MRITNLEILHRSMLGQLNQYGEPIEHQSFRSQHGAVEFECIFSTGERPYKLSMVSRGTVAHPQSEFFLFDVSETYEISSYFPTEDYKRLANLLRTRNGEAFNRLNPNEFLAQLNNNTPTIANHAATPRLDVRLEARPDITEDQDKRYFSHWRRPNRRDNGTPGQVSLENRRKTAMISSAALAYSDQIGKSSCWSPIPTQANWREHD
ncbi:DUF6037 family protein [Pseudomonas alliivorans]|nr:DUF6037 family protein [Pseudomonas alliivorans]MEE4701981.1 DUF6037 family protein [Pseudomonas alliivorans]MEE4737840.1 DUF6037 family protein [Pseudomonas alliivorans]